MSLYDAASPSPQQPPPSPPASAAAASFTFQTAPLPSPPLEKPYHTKRPHKKSRTGCRNCKARKVKCDEAHPSCRSCTLRKIECVYPTPPPSPTPQQQQQQQQQQQRQKTSSNDGANHGALVLSRSRPPIGADNEHLVVFGDLGHRPLGIQVDEMDMKLLWWYTTETYASFAVTGHPSSLIESSLKVHMVQLAFQNPFLMNAILGMTSLHLQSRQKSIPLVRALNYRASAFEGYRRAVERADPETYPALLACSLMLCALSSQAFRDPDSKALYILDWMVVWRGIGIIVDMAKPRLLLQSGLHHLFYRPKINLEETTSYIPSRLLFMIQSIPFTDPEHAYVGKYYSTLKYLGSLYKELRTVGFGPILDLRVITFFTFLPQAYVDLARAKQPRALVILAHYLMFMGHVRYVWWVEGICDTEIRNIAGAVGSEWQSLLEIPLASLEAGTQIERARIILENDQWMPPQGEKYDPDDQRLQELGWVDDRGREVVLETGQLVDDPEGTLVNGHNPREGPDGSKMAHWNIKQTLRTVDGDEPVSNKYPHDQERGIIPLVGDSEDTVPQPIPFYTLVKRPS